MERCALESGKVGIRAGNREGKLKRIDGGSGEICEWRKDS
jgi:hypothetical protein